MYLFGNQQRRSLRYCNKRKMSYTTYRQNNIDSKRFAVGWLTYVKDSSSAGYFYSACAAAQRLRQDVWFNTNTDLILIYPKHYLTAVLLQMARQVFDIVIEYTDYLLLAPPTLNPGWTCNRWSHVFGKTHFWNPDILPYERVLVMDTELIVKDFTSYKSLFDVVGDYVGVLETFGCSDSWSTRPVDPKYGHYGSGCYTDINAGVIVLKPSRKDFQDLVELIHGGWKIIEKSKNSAFWHRDIINRSMWLPEQELYTCFFVGRSTSISQDFFSIIETPYHWAFDTQGTKLWCLPPGSPAHIVSIYLSLWDTMRHIQWPDDLITLYARFTRYINESGCITTWPRNIGSNPLGSVELKSSFTGHYIGKQITLTGKGTDKDTGKGTGKGTCKGTDKGTGKGTDKGTGKGKRYG
jgi:hypothetical protein